jgi:RNA polymerase sigma-B factor
VEWSVEEVLEAMQALRAYESLSLDAPVKAGEEEDASYVESIGEDDPRYELVELGASLSAALRVLDPADRRLLQLRFFGELTQTQIAKRLGISQMQVSRLLNRCLEQLREQTLAVAE